MKKILLCIILTAIVHFAGAQAGEWTWMKGVASPFGSAGNWGVIGVPDPANEPPNVYEACEWKDQQDNLWIFGGINNSAIIYYGTLWKYSIASNTWVWMNGPGIPDQPGVYGTQGVSSPSNYPGARGWGELSWTDSSGNFWLFGGYGYDANGTIGCLGDLWKYDVAINEWTWMKGSSTANYTGSYGVQGTADISNNPPSRQEASCAWKDSKNNLWMFAGWSTTGNLNDLWKYEIPSNQWTWISGNNTANHYGVYGTLGVSSPSNMPGSRAAYSRWIDKDDNLWFYGGNGYGLNANGFLSDLWKYDVITNEWTWMSGSGLIFQPGVHGAKCEFSSTHFPSDKYEGRSCWVDDCGYFFIYGGTGYNGHQGDLWVYNSVSNEWAWVSGDTTTNTSAVPGTQGVSDPSNKPGLRTGSNSWIDQSGNLWLFGGYVCSNDMWRFVPDYSCIGNVLCSINQQTNFAASDTQLCEKFCVDFFDSSLNNTTGWQWLFPGGSPASSTLQNPTGICYNNPGTYDVTLITTNPNGTDTLTLTGYITVNSTPPIPVITQSGYTLTSSTAPGYQWQFNSTNISGATNQSYTVTQTGLYSVIITDENGCTSSASEYVTITGIENVFSENDVLIYPNPSEGSFMVEWLNGLMVGEIKIEIANTLGEIVFSSIEKISAHDFKKEIDLCRDARHCVSAGIYFIEVSGNNTSDKRETVYVKKKIIISK